VERKFLLGNWYSEPNGMQHYCHVVVMCNDCCREGHIPDIIACGSLHEFLCKAHKQYGPIISFWLGPKMFISLGSAELFAQQANVFDRSGKLCIKNFYFILLQFCLFDMSVAATSQCGTYCVWS